MCGEELSRTPVAKVRKGTPPRVWGRDHISGINPLQLGDTPTCVGKSSASVNFAFSERGHPHVCGEEYHNVSLFSDVKGTPPRVWGRDHVQMVKIQTIWDTPTCVGKRYLAYRNDEARYWGHPHVCGEEGLFCLLVYLCKGTPPRVWGRVTEYGSNPDTQRDTPTCVGKRSHCCLLA